MSFFFIFLASLSVAFGTYVLSSAFSLDSALANFLLYKHSKILFIGIGILFNLLGSIFWILGRRLSTSYLLAWSLYLGLLVLFGAVISILIEQQSISSMQIVGLIC